MSWPLVAAGIVSSRNRLTVSIVALADGDVSA